MASFNNGENSKDHQRFIDAAEEPLSMMTPIKGYDQMPLVSLEEAVKPLISMIPDVEQMVYIAKQRCKKPPPNKLTPDQSAAIILYTIEWEPKEKSIYYGLNKALRTEDRQVLRPWFLYLKLFFTALSLLPSSRRTVFRGVKTDMKQKYKKDDLIVWWGFSSCTSTMDVLNNNSFLGSSGTRTFFTIECDSGKDIREHSYFSQENEILLPAARALKVEGIVPQPDGLSLIQLKEIQPKYPLLESFSSVNQIVQSNPINPNPKKIQKPSKVFPNVPIIIQPANPSSGQPHYDYERLQLPMLQGDLSAIDDTSKKIYAYAKCIKCVCTVCCFIFCCPCTTYFYVKK